MSHSCWHGGLALAVHLSPKGAEPVGGRGTAEHKGQGRGIAVEDRPRRRDCADLPFGSAGEAAEEAGPCAGRRAGSGRCSGADRGELGRQELNRSGHIPVAGAF